MTVSLKISIECRKNTCNTSAYQECRFKAVRWGGVPFCRLFRKELQGGEYKTKGNTSYKEYMRCKECKEAQID